MENIKSKLENYQIKKSARNINFSYQALREEIVDFYKVRVSDFNWLFFKVEENLIRESFNHCRQRKTPFQSFIKKALYLAKERNERAVDNFS